MRLSAIRAGVTIAAILGLAAPAALASGLPKLPDASGHLSSRQFKVRPSTILISGDGSFFFAGRKKPGHKAAPLNWTSWTASGGHGKGLAWLDNCKPSCAAGTFHRYPVRLHAWRPRHLGGHFIFTRLTYTYTGTIPPRSRRSYVLQVEQPSHGTFGWATTG